MTTPPYQPGPYGQPNDPYGQGGYGQQRPPQQPQYGQPQYGAPYGGANDQTQSFGTAPQYPYGATQQWPGGGYGGMTPPPEPPKKNNGMVVAIVVIALLVIAGAGAGLYFLNKDGGNNTAGSETSTSASDKTDSSSDETTGDDTTEETAPEETEAAPGEAIDAQPGDCIKVNVASSSNADVETIDCANPEAIYRVATREDDDTASCPNDQYVSYTEAGQLLLCLQLNVKQGDCIEVSGQVDKRTDCTAPGATHKVVYVLDGVDDENQCSDATTEVITYPQPPLTICLGSPTA